MTESIRILYLEKDRSLINQARRKLEIKNYHLDGVVDSVECMAKLDAAHFDILLVDYLSISSDLDILQKIFDRGGALSVFVTIETKELHSLSKIMEQGCADYILKDNEHYLDLLILSIDKELEKQQLITEKNYLEKELKRFHFYTPSMRVETEHRIELITYLRSAIVKNELSLVYQPVVDIVTNEAVSAEALLRWEHPRLGFISPVEFIPLAEESGLIKAIGNWVVLNVAKDIQRWKAMGLKPIAISINKSPAQFSKQLCDENWNDIFEAHDIPLSNITLEITETIFMEKGRNYIDHLSKLKSLGVQIALDDFGTGYSSLSYLKHFPVDILKIDREFIKDITTNDSDALLVESIIILAEKMNIKVIAEGVETEEQLNILKHYNCRYVQGYYFSKPLTVNKFERYLGQ
ncbi:MAG: EAL domain-containing protein [Methylococcales symbiont of Hymedesmia sp. n. MRB-2018]|nr:MAG: EAL domain-containing protein [Methylococcales symbiont of Hymedesmia sp. n. MRB-2018]KAF3983962.1 MAG: EAL domain-containing protein [Methylococcales symbiont of Hymedesmia sp. n. MRB-2018]